ncbi:hypothetical protein Emag_001236 [Eimeria magna]
MQQALMEVLEDFHKDNVVYLELRSSLKRIPEEGVDPQSYVDMLVEGCKAAEAKWGMTEDILGACLPSSSRHCANVLHWRGCCLDVAALRWALI